MVKHINNYDEINIDEIIIKIANFMGLESHSPIDDVFYYTTITGMLIPVPDYLHDMTAAWSILKKINEDYNASVGVSMVHYDSELIKGNYNMCSIYYKDDEVHHHATDVEPSICLSAYRFLNMIEETGDEQNKS